MRRRRRGTQLAGRIPLRRLRPDRPRPDRPGLVRSSRVRPGRASSSWAWCRATVEATAEWLALGARLAAAFRSRSLLLVM